MAMPLVCRVFITGSSTHLSRAKGGALSVTLIATRAGGARPGHQAWRALRQELRLHALAQVSARRVLVFVLLLGEVDAVCVDKLRTQPERHVVPVWDATAPKELSLERKNSYFRLEAHAPIAANADGAQRARQQGARLPAGGA